MMCHTPRNVTLSAVIQQATIASSNCWQKCNMGTDALQHTQTPGGAALLLSKPKADTSLLLIPILNPWKASGLLMPVMLGSESKEYLTCPPERQRVC